jgi:predicted nuclease of predicted toxin-antitoxin system
LVIVNKNADFSDRIITNSPRVVPRRFGNLRRNEFHALPAHDWPQIETRRKFHKLVNVCADRLEGIG